MDLVDAIFLCICIFSALITGVQSRGSPRAIRLVGPIAYIGQVQIFHETKWVSVCQDQWNTYNAKVVCRQLGYADQTSARAMNYAQLDGDQGTTMQGFQCSGNEATLDLCPILAGNWSDRECSKGMAGVICKTPTESSSPVRLVGGRGDHEGRVEIKHGGQWTTVCDKEWDKRDADIVCHQLGYKKALRASTRAEYGQGTGTILLSNVQCRRDDLKYRYDVRYCNVTNWYPDTDECTHARDAGVVCEVDDTKLEVRLTGDDSDIVQIKYNDDWMSICDENWNMLDANVVCRQLGYQSATSAPKTGYHGWQGYYLRNFLCNGSEIRLDQCKKRGEWTLNRCGSDKFAGVRCTDGFHTVIHHTSSSSLDGGRHATHNKVSAVESVIVVAIVCGIMLFIFSGYFVGHKARQRRKRKDIGISLQLDGTDTVTVSLEENEMDAMHDTDNAVEETDDQFVAVEDNIPLVKEEED